ncbi:hypothetical protein VN97_g7159, partial [Penicillium thymicola]
FNLTNTGFQAKYLSYPVLFIYLF